MKRNKNGFTLIELLAVIVILAIIALIAVPVVMNIITKSRKSAFKDSAYGIIKAGELYYADRLLEPEGMTEDVTFTFPNNTTGLEINGSLPSSGSVMVSKEGKVAIGVTDGKYCITKGFEDIDVIVTEAVESCLNPETPTLSDLATTGTFSAVDGSFTSEVSEVHTCATDKTEGACAPGTPFAIRVNDRVIYKFYVINDTGNEVTLIMDRNLYTEENLKNNTHDVAWYADADDNSYGPLTALKVLKSRTSTWTNIPAYTYTLKDDDGQGGSYGYKEVTGEIVENVRARLPKYSEIAIFGTVSDNGLAVTNLPDYLKENCYNTGDNNSLQYWTSTARSTNILKAWASGENLNSGPVTTLIGIRPVIELSK